MIMIGITIMMIMIRTIIMMIMTRIMIMIGFFMHTFIIYDIIYIRYDIVAHWRSLLLFSLIPHLWVASKQHPRHANGRCTTMQVSVGDCCAGFFGGCAGHTHSYDRPFLLHLATHYCICRPGCNTITPVAYKPIVCLHLSLTINQSVSAMWAFIIHHKICQRSFILSVSFFAIGHILLPPTRPWGARGSSSSK